MKFSEEKKCVLKRRSESRQAQAARRMLKINMRGSDIPLARRSMVVTLKLSALRRDAAQKMATLTIQSVIPDWGEIKNAPVRPTNEATVAQNARRFSVGKAISRAPICSGRK